MYGLTLRGVGLQLPTQMRRDVAASTFRSLRLQVQTSKLESARNYIQVNTNVTTMVNRTKLDLCGSITEVMLKHHYPSIFPAYGSILL